MNAQQIAERYAGHPFLDYFDCLIACVESARSRNKRAVRARLAGEDGTARLHRVMARWYLDRARQWHNMIDWSDE